VEVAENLKPWLTRPMLADIRDHAECALVRMDLSPGIRVIGTKKQVGGRGGGGRVDNDWRVVKLIGCLWFERACLTPAPAAAVLRHGHAGGERQAAD
jgi:hypothetical protein